MDKVKTVVQIVLMVMGIVTMGAVGQNYVVMTKAILANNAAEQQVNMAKQQMQLVTALVNDLQGMKNEEVDVVLAKYLKTPEKEESK